MVKTYHSSVRTSQRKMMLNRDVFTTTLQTQPAIDFVYGVRDVRDVNDQRKPLALTASQIVKFSRGFMLEITHW